MIGVMTLNIVLAVMTGFEEDLRDRILGFTPHVLVTGYGASMPDDPSWSSAPARACPASPRRRRSSTAR